jgi:WD40 repeat protein
VLRLPNSGNRLHLSVDGTRLAFSSWDGARVHLYELALPGAVQRFTAPQPTRYPDHYTAQAAFSPGDELVAAVDKEGVYLFQPPNPIALAHLASEPAYTVQFQSDGSALLTSVQDGVRRWPMTWSADRSELYIGPPAILEPTRGQLVNYFDLSRDGQWMVAATKQAFLSFDPEESVVAIRADARIQPGDRPYLSRDGRLAVNCASAKAAPIQIWNPRTGMLLTNLPACQVQDAAFSPDGHWLACAAIGETTFWRIQDWSPRHRIAHSIEAPGHYHVTFSPNSRVAALSVSDHEVRLMLVETGEELATLPTRRMLNWLTFSPGGDRLAMVFEPGYFELWNLRRLRKELAAMNLDWPDTPLPPERSAIEKIRITVVADASKPVTFSPSSK